MPPPAALEKLKRVKRLRASTVVTLETRTAHRTIVLKAPRAKRKRR